MTKAPMSIPTTFTVNESDQRLVSKSLMVKKLETTFHVLKEVVYSGFGLFADTWCRSWRNSSEPLLMARLVVAGARLKVAGGG